MIIRTILRRDDVIMKYIINFLESESIVEQGKEYEIYEKYGKEWKIRKLGGGNGNWLLTKKKRYLELEYK